MNIIQCQFCKKPFVPINGKICPACLEQLDKDFTKVRDYLYENEMANLDKIAEATEVDKRKIMYLIKEGRLTIDGSDGEGGGVLQCGLCKKSIKAGRLCEGCAEKISSKMDKSVSQSNSKTAEPSEKNKKVSASIR